MSRQFLKDILPLVRHPSHYLGSETNAIRKDPAKVRLRVALAFPDLYEVGMSHLGIQILYHVLNARHDFAAERVFAPGPDLEDQLRATSTPLCSLETSTPLSEFDVIGFSLLYELTFTNILNMLHLSRIPFEARERDKSDPFVIAGGPCTFNPEPIAECFDAMVIGDGEVVILEMADAWLEWKLAGADRQALLEIWAKIEGVYVPSLFAATVDNKGFQNVTPMVSGYDTVRKTVVPDLDRVPYPDRSIIAFGKPIHDRLSLEICRGCTRGCRFCQAGMIYRPVRERAPERLLALAKRALAQTGYEDVSLLSLSAGDYSAIQGLMEGLMNHCAGEKIAVSLPSLRVGSLTPGLMTQIKRVRKTGFTIAPEAGSQRLRNVINKNITEEDLEKTIRNAFALGWQLIKLYFMIGLPTETEEDLNAIVTLVRRLQSIAASSHGRNKINVSVSTFIPKAHTPFQWCSQISLAESREKIAALRSKIKGQGLRFKWQTPEMSILEGLWARGDRRLCRLLVKAYGLGCRFDGWSEHFQYGLWQEAIEACGIDLDFYTTRTRELSEPLPWDHMDSRVSKTYLKEEWQRAIAGATTADCREGECSLCGVCDFEDIKPVTFESERALNPRHIPQRRSDKPLFRKLLVSYAKQGPAKYFGHLELMKIFMRAFRRARIPLRFSQGFHPMPKMSFDAALPVGIETTEEHFSVEVAMHVQPVYLMERVNEQLPEGLSITACAPVSVGIQAEAIKTFRYTVTLGDGTFSENKVEEFLKSATWPLVKTNRKGNTRTVDLKDAVAELSLLAPSTMQMGLRARSGSHVTCKEALSSIFGLSDRALALATIIKEPADGARR